MNAKHDGTATIFIYRSGKHYVGVCLELDIVDNGSDIDVLAERMKAGVESYVKYVCRRGASGKALLSRPAPKHYWKKYQSFLRQMSEMTEAVPATKRRVAAREYFFLTRNLSSWCLA